MSFPIFVSLLLPLCASWLQECVTYTGITLAVVVAIAIAGLTAAVATAAVAAVRWVRAVAVAVARA